MQLIDFALAVEIEPDHHRRPYTSVHCAKGVVGQEKPAVSPGNLANAAILSAPVLVEADALLVVRSSLGHIFDRYLGHGVRKLVIHCGSRISPFAPTRSWPPRDVLTD